MLKKEGITIADLSDERRLRRKRRRRITYVIYAVLCILVMPFIVANIDSYLSNGFHMSEPVAFYRSFNYVVNSSTCIKLWVFICLGGVWFVYASMSKSDDYIVKTDKQTVTESIEIPKAVGDGQHGSARFMNEEEKEKNFQMVVYDGNGKISGLKHGGLIVEMKKENGKEYIRYLDDDQHAIIIAATRSGKTRRIMLESIWLTILAGENLVITDPKGEIFYYTSEFAEKHDYEIWTFNLRSPNQSMHYNYLQPVLDALKKEDISLAIDRTWDIVSALVGEPKGEPIWHNGETSVIAASILIVAVDAPEEYRNLTNVYYFLCYMCESVIDENGMQTMPINRYMEEMAEDHPAKVVFATAQVAAFQTRSSFFTSALGTLKNFINWNIAEMTSKSDYNLDDFSKGKHILYFIIPDEKDSLYGLVTVYIKQLYESLVQQAVDNGGRLPIDVWFDLDELGNFPKIPGYGAMLSAGASRGIKINMVIQDYQQLEKKYKDDYDNIKSNCLATSYLRTASPKTQKELSERLGKYTVQTTSVSASVNTKDNQNLNYSNNAQMSGRELLTAEEIGRFKTPDALVYIMGEYTAVTHLPDLSEWYANTEMGLGDKEHNRKLIMEREAKIPKRKVGAPQTWGIWKEYKNAEFYGYDVDDEDEEQISEEE